MEQVFVAHIVSVNRAGAVVLVHGLRAFLPGFASVRHDGDRRHDLHGIAYHFS